MITTDVLATPEMALDHGLSSAEWEKITETLGRKPNVTELGVFSAMWNEHCSYKSSRIHLKKFPTQGPHVLQGTWRKRRRRRLGPRHGRGVQDGKPQSSLLHRTLPGRGYRRRRHFARHFYDGRAAHRATRQPAFSGRRSIPAHPTSVSGVVGGIAGYGNCIGVPTVGGETKFHPCYNGNILVNVMCVGIMRSDAIFRGTASGVGNPVIYVGAPTGARRYSWRVHGVGRVR